MAKPPPPQRPRLYLLDANNYVYRAFHSTNPKRGGYASSLSTSKGMPTNAIYVFVNMVRKLVREHEPTHFVAIFDPPGDRSFRHEVYPEYKATRSETPDDLKVQLPYVRPIVRGMGLSVLEVARWEADDVIATVARRANEAGWEAVIVTSDKDMYQLLRGDDVRMYDGMKEAWIDLAAVHKKFGVDPEKVTEVQALVGDKIDNIPGIAGVGPKTAANLIDKYGDLEGIYEHIGELKGKLRERLENHREDAFLSRRLARLEQNVDVDVTLESFSIDAPDTDTLVEMFGELEFKTLLREYQRVAVPVRETLRRTIGDAAGLADLVAALSAAEEIAIEIIRSEADYARAELVGLGFATAGHESWYVPLSHRYLGMPEQLDRATAIEALRPFLEGPQTTRVVHDHKVLAVVLRRIGVTLGEVALDTQLASYLINATKYEHSLDNIALDVLQLRLPVAPERVLKGREPWSRSPVEAAANVAQSRAEAVLRAARFLRADLKETEQGRLLAEVEIPLSRVLADVELAGVRVDPAVLAELSQRFGDKMAGLERACHSHAGPFNLGSPKQLADVLFRRLELPVIKKTKTGASTDASVLDQLLDKHPIVQQILDWRSVSKLKSTYTDVLPGLIHPDTGRIHTSLRQAVAATGRLSSFDPNLQNIPIRTEEGRQIRDAFIAGEGCQLVSADYSQIELRVLAHLTGDPGLIAAFAEGKDIHRSTASESFGVPEEEVTYEQRSAAKAINFGLMYGMGAFRLGRDLHISRAEAQGYIDMYFERYSKVKAFMDETIAQGRELGYVSTILGRRRYVPELRSRNFARRGAAERAAINSPVQGSAADLIKLAMLRIDKALRTRALGAKMVLQVHDELVFDVPTDEIATLEAMVQHEMETVYELAVPLVVEVAHGHNWNEAH